MIAYGIGIRGSASSEGALYVKQWSEINVDKIRRLATPAAYSILVDVAVHHQHLGRTRGKAGQLAALREGLGACADVFGVRK